MSPPADTCSCIIVLYREPTLSALTPLFVVVATLQVSLERINDLPSPALDFQEALTVIISCSCTSTLGNCSVLTSLNTIHSSPSSACNWVDP